MSIEPLPVLRTPAVQVPNSLVTRVAAHLLAHETAGGLRDVKTRARFMVRATTGKRPSEIMRTQPTDVDLARRVWTPRDGKGGFCPGVYLNAEMLAAWRLFVTAKAWGPFNTGAHARVLRTAGWPIDVDPYQLFDTAPASPSANAGTTWPTSRNGWAIAGWKRRGAITCRSSVPDCRR